MRNSPPLRADTRSWTNLPVRSISALAWAMTNFSSLSAVRNSMWSVTRPLTAFRRLDRADPAVVRRMDVAHFESRALAGETARTEGREPALVSQLRQRVGL